MAYFDASPDSQIWKGTESSILSSTEPCHLLFSAPRSSPVTFFACSVTSPGGSPTGLARRTFPTGSNHGYSTPRPHAPSPDNCPLWRSSMPALFTRATTPPQAFVSQEGQRPARLLTVLVAVCLLRHI